MPKYDSNYIIDDLLDSYRVKINKLYNQIEERLNIMEGYVRFAEDHPADLTPDETIEVRDYLGKVGTEQERFFLLFTGFSDD